MDAKINYSEKAYKQLKKIKKSNSKDYSGIIRKIEAFAGDPGGNFDVKHLKGKLGSFQRLRTGDYRIIFDMDKDIIYIYTIKHRRDAYND